YTRQRESFQHDPLATLAHVLQTLANPVGVPAVMRQRLATDAHASLCSVAQPQIPVLHSEHGRRLVESTESLEAAFPHDGAGQGNKAIHQQRHTHITLTLRLGSGRLPHPTP